MQWRAGTVVEQVRRWPGAVEYSVALDEAALRAQAATLRAEGLSARDVVRVLMETAHAPRNLAYRIAHE